MGSPGKVSFGVGKRKGEVTIAADSDVIERGLF